MMNSHHHDTIFVAEHRRKLLSEAENWRLMRAGRPRRLAVYLRVLGGVGDWMIAGGTRLKARRQSAVEALRASSYQPSAISSRG